MNMASNYQEDSDEGSYQQSSESLPEFGDSHTDSEAASDSGSDSEEDALTSSKRNVCMHYNRGHCRFGDKCRNEHICKDFLKGSCKFGAGCRLNHNSQSSSSGQGRRRSRPSSAASGNHFEWQLFNGQQWGYILNDFVIEAHYCQPGANGITINLSIGPAYIDFDEMTVDGPLVNLSVRRNMLLSPPNQKELIGWYYKDNHQWCEYGSQGSGGRSSSIRSDFIEQQYNRNPRGSVQFTVGSTTYKLDFTAMTQTNLSTYMLRKVRRRTKFNEVVTDNSSNQNSLPTLASPSANPSNSSSHYIWEFMGDEGIWTEYQKPVSSSVYTQPTNTVKTSPRISSQARWQFKDMDGQWKDYIKGGSWGCCSVSCQDIEAQYQQDSTGIMRFRADIFSYELDFSDMTQTNLSTNATRSVRRL
ncbi:zinc finger CCCH-type antiviral protein 1-like [Sinocyclocheilus anshuiensis]|uniref:zinc finger CCCH-type antiviral protein 1-like n=1 Tax=Sinocyclocheilus anshuiensis TaxID=1608454 RepID=UPI0007B900DF|nr:PREDICTED: zinc finger CCCH-type antiviral protein 1-like [Sinocyclocheilus anshuiensis]